MQIYSDEFKVLWRKLTEKKCSGFVSSWQKAFILIATRQLLIFLHTRIAFGQSAEEPTGSIDPFRTMATVEEFFWTDDFWPSKYVGLSGERLRSKKRCPEASLDVSLTQDLHSDNQCRVATSTDSIQLAQANSNRPKWAFEAVSPPKGAQFESI